MQTFSFFKIPHKREIFSKVLIKRQFFKNLLKEKIFLPKYFQNCKKLSFQGNFENFFQNSLRRTFFKISFKKDLLQREIFLKFPIKRKLLNFFQFPTKTHFFGKFPKKRNLKKGIIFKFPTKGFLFHSIFIKISYKR